MSANRAPELAALAEAFRSRHRPGRPVVLPNAWDAASAVAVVQAGFGAVATTSSGLAAALGWEDHERAPAAEVFAAVGRISRSVTVPVTADLEGGYGLPPDELVDRLLAAGAVGCNLEDSDHRAGADAPLLDADEHAAYLAAVKDAGRAAGVDIVLNARIDVYVRGVGDPASRADETRRRARRYRDAGADCVYPIAIRDRDALAAIVADSGGADTGGAVNVLALPGWLSLGELAGLGVARVSYGGSLFHHLQQALAARLGEIMGELQGVAAPSP
jgi:2-methylisocitrate lyase-like PEP mutase family enzyme